MNRFMTIVASAVLVTLCAACRPTAEHTGMRTKKVVEQRLAAYTPIRRLTYRDACGSDGALSLCVDRINLSDSAVVVEARIRNGSSEGYVLNSTQGASVFLADKSGRILACDGGKSTEYPGMKETAVSFRMEGYFSGEPYAVMVNSLRKKAGDLADHSLSVVALLGE